MMEKFMRLEKVDWGETPLAQQRKTLEDIKGPEDVTLPFSSTDFYKLCEVYNQFNVDYKIYKKGDFWVVEVQK